MNDGMIKDDGPTAISPTLQDVYENLYSVMNYAEELKRLSNHVCNMFEHPFTGDNSVEKQEAPAGKVSTQMPNLIDIFQARASDIRKSLGEIEANLNSIKHKISHE